MKAGCHRPQPAAEKLIAIFAQLNFQNVFFLDSLPTRVAAGFVLSAIIASVARGTRSLSPSGALAAVIVATACSAAGWSWAFILIGFFAISTGLSGISESSKRALTEDIVVKGGERDAWQVLANGGLFATLGATTLILPHPAIFLAAAGAIASSTADTWSTEIGTLSRRMPRSIVSWKPVPAGTSGGVTLPGTFAQVCGAIFIAMLAAIFNWPAGSPAAAIVGGITGSLADSVLGATLQERRWCERCGRGTERAVHTCGMSTNHLNGFHWLGNDGVNFLSTLAGALAGLSCLA